jgi:hypothetical protein
MYRQLLQLTGRFIFNITLFSAATVHTVMYAVPEVSRPGASAAAIVAALIIAMYDLGVFRVEVDSDLTFH